MRINSISSFNTNPLSFQADKKQQSSMQKATKAMILATALSGIAGCEGLDKVTHNHFFQLPVDTFTKTELVATPVPPQIIFIENDLPGRTDTVITPGKTDTIYKEIVDTLIIEKPGKNDTIYIEKPAETDTIYVDVPGKTDTVYVEKPVPPDTIYVEKPLPPDTIIIEKPGKNDTIYIDKPPKVDTVYVDKPPKVDTVYVDKPPRVDTVYVDRPVPPDTVIIPAKPDTVFVPKNDTIYVEQDPDTVYVEQPPIVERDTITLPGDTIYVKKDWTSPVPPKQEELYDRLGIETTGNGKFFIATTYYDKKNNMLVQRHLNGQASSRDGRILVYNVVKTKWDNKAEGVVLGKNELFEKQLVYLSEDGTELGMKIMSPKVDPKISNENKKSNWVVFEKGTLSTPSAWEDTGAFFATYEGGKIKLSNGFSLRKAEKPQSVTVTNPYESEWDLKDWNVLKGDPD